MLAVMASMALNAWAIEEGSYIVSNETHYINPDTEESADGGDSSIGEAACRRTTYSQSYYEFKDGKHYVTLRLMMASFLDNIRISVQTEKGNEDSYELVEHTVSGQNTEEDSKDFRFEISSTDVLIKPTFFVGPMNRDVTYFVSLDMETAKNDEGEFNSFNEAESVDAESTTLEEENVDESTTSKEDNINESTTLEEDDVIEETESESDIVITMTVDDEADKSTDTTSEPNNELQTSQDITPNDNTAPVAENTQENEEDSDSSLALADDEKENSTDTATEASNESQTSKDMTPNDNATPVDENTQVNEEAVDSSLASEDAEKDSVEVETETDGVESKQVIANNDNIISLNDEKSEETVGITEFNEEGAKKLPEKEEDNSKSRAPIIGSVLVLGMGAFLIYSKKSR